MIMRQKGHFLPSVWMHCCITITVLYQILDQYIHIIICSSSCGTSRSRSRICTPSHVQKRSRTFGWRCPDMFKIHNEVWHEFKICFSHYENALGNSVLAGIQALSTYFQENRKPMIDNSVSFRLNQCAFLSLEATELVDGEARSK